MGDLVKTNLSHSWELFNALVTEAAEWYGKLGYEWRAQVTEIKQFYRDRFNADPSNWRRLAVNDFVEYEPLLDEDTAYQWIFNKAMPVELEQLLMLHAYFLCRHEWCGTDYLIK